MMRNAERAARATRRPGLLPLAWLLVIVSLAGPGTLWAGGPGTWAPMPDMPSARAGHTATLLLDGNVLIAGGKDASGQALSTTELFNPATGAYLRVGDLAAPVWGHTATLLQDGTVLIAGGRGSSGQPVATAQVYDPGTKLFSPLTMNSPRAEHTATRLADGRVLVAGGSDGSNPLAGLEVYDPNSKAFSSASNSLLAARQSHTATLLGDGRVLLAGGSNASGVLASVEIFNPADGTVAAAGALNVARTLASAARLLDGTVLVAGGQDGAAQDLNSAEVFDPAKNTFAPLSVQMSTARSGHIGLFLENNGKVLIAGGTNAGQLVTTAEVYDSVLGAFWQPASPAVARQLFGANFFLAPYTGMLLASGGLDSNSYPLASSEAFIYPTIRSDKPDYQPGDTVVLMGERWLPGEQIGINIHEFNTDPDINIIAPADASGAFTINAFQIDRSDIGQHFTATASGPTSRWTAQTTFTDNIKIAVSRQSPTAQSITEASGSTFTVQYQISNTNNGPDSTTPISGTYTLALTGGLTLAANPPGQSPSGTFTLAGGASTGPSWTIQAPTGPATGTITLTANITSPSCGSSGDKCSDSAQYTVTVSAPTCTPVAITTNPTNQTVDVGQIATFMAAASGNPTPTVQWQVSTTGGVSFTDVGGATNTSLNVTPTDNTFSGYQYRAVFTNTCSGTQTATTTAATLTVNLRSTSTSVSLNPASVVVGQASTATMTVTDTDSNGTKQFPTGTVAVTSDSGDTITGTCSLASTATPGVSTCSVTVTPTSFGTGTHNITGTFSATRVHAGSNNSAALAVARRATSVSVAMSPISVPVGVGSTATVTVTDTDTGDKQFPTGNVSVTSSDNTDTITGTCSLSSSATPGVSTCLVTVTAVAFNGGARTISGTFSQTSVHQGNSNTASLTVTRRTTSVSVAMSPISVPVGVGSTATVTVTDTDTGDKQFPTGNVSVTSSDVSDTISSPCTLASTAAPGVSTCSATVTPTGFNGGSRTITATFPETGIHLGSSNNTTLAVSRRTTTTSISLSPSSVVVAQDSTATITVTDTSSAGTKTNPGVGTSVAVTSDSGDTVTGTCILVALSADKSTCQVTVTPNGFGTGTHNITATFSATNVHDTSTNTAALAVSRRATMTSVQLTPNSVVTGQASTAAITVADTEAKGTKLFPTGIVSLSSSDGTDSFAGTCSLINSLTSGVSICSMTVKPTHVDTGSHTITATFSQTDVHLGSNNTATLTVSRASTSITNIAAVPEPSVLGASYTVSWTLGVVTPGSGTPTGTVTVSDAKGNTCSATAPGSNSCIVLSSTVAGPLTLTVSYAGDLDFNGTSGTGSHTVSYGFAGLFSPYAPPSAGVAYKINSAIPLKWQYTDVNGTVVASPNAAPVVQIYAMGVCGGGDTTVITVNDAGASGYQYDPTTSTWQFNWKTTGLNKGCYDIYIKSNLTGQTNGAFPVQLR